jgi:uncharacterized protein
VLPSQGRSHWFEPSIAHHKRKPLPVKVARENIELLKELQSLDLEIMEFEKQKTALPQEIAEAVERIEAAKKDMDALSAEVKYLSEKRRESENILEDKLSKIEQLRSQKNMVTTNASYTALLKEIEEAEQEQSRAEENILAYMERVEELSKSVERRKTEIAEGEKELNALNEKNRLRIEEIGLELSALLSRRADKASAIDSGVLPLYEKTRKLRTGIAFVPVEGNACGGCSMELRPQVISELMKGEVLVCDGCSRLLYYEEKKI